MPNPKLETYKNKATGTVYDFTDADAQSKVTATVDLLKDTTGWLGGNDLPNYRGLISERGVTYTRNADMSVTANGTQDGTGDGADWTPLTAPKVNNSRFKISDFPKFSNSVFSVGVTVDANITVGIWYYNSSNQYIGLQTVSSGEKSLIINPPQNAVYFTPYFRVNKNKTVSNLTFYPMIIDKELFALNPTYRPYHGSVEEVKADKSSVISALDDTVGWVGQNKIPFPYNLSDVSGSGITFTADANGVVDADGTTSGVSSLYFSRRDGVAGNKMLLPAGTWKVVGGKSSNAYLSVGCTENNAYKLIGTDTGNGFVFTLTEPTYIQISLDIYNTTVSHEKISPMVSTKEQYDLSPTFKPPHESVEDWYWSENAKTGVHNFLNTEKFETGTKDGITLTVRPDKGISLTGTPTIQSGTIFFRNYGTILKAGTYKYKLNKNPKGSCVVGVNDSISGLGNYKVLTTLTTNMTEISFTVTDEDLASKPYVFCELGVHYSAGTIDEVYYPQILLNEDTFGGFMPFAMTNRQLTDAVTPKKLEETSTSEQAARITVPTSFRIAYAFVSLDADKTFQCVVVKGISSRAFRFTYKASSNTEVRGYIWYDYTNSRIEVGSFMINDVEMKNDTNIKLEVFYI